MGTTNTLDLNNRVTELENAVSGGDSNQANKADIATEFNTTTAYTAGCFVYYGGKLYQFNADHAAGAWDPTDVVVANVTDQVVSNKAAIDELAESYTADKVMLSDGVTSVEDALDGHISVTNSGSETTSSMLNRLWALVDLSKVTPRSVLFFNGAVSCCIYTKTSAALTYSVTNYNATTKLISVLNFVITNSGSVAIQTLTNASGTTSENNFSTRTTDSGFTLYY